MDRKPAGATNSSTRHVFETMRTISRSDTPIGLNEIATELDVPASTAHRALMTLEESGFVRRMRQSARFEPGSTLLHLIRSMVAQFPVRAAAAGALNEISGELGVTTSLNWRLGWSSIRLASFEGMQESFQLRRIGEMRPLHDGIGPSAILLALPKTERERYLREYVDGGKLRGATGLDLERFETFERQMAELRAISSFRPPTSSASTGYRFRTRRFDGAVGGSFSVGFSMNQRTGAELAADIERVREALARLQDALDSDPPSTKTYFDALDPDAFGVTTSPSLFRNVD